MTPEEKKEKATKRQRHLVGWSGIVLAPLFGYTFVASTVASPRTSDDTTLVLLLFFSVASAVYAIKYVVGMAKK